MENPVVSAISIIGTMCAGIFVFNLNYFKIPLNEYASGIVTELIGIIVTLIFVQIIFDKNSMIKEKKAEADAILRCYKVLKSLTNWYVVYYVCVSTPIEERNIRTSDISIENMNEKFDLKDMRDLYFPTLLVRDTTKSSAKAFCESEKRLREYMIHMLENIDFKHFPKLASTLEEYINISINYDVSEGILSQENTMLGEQRATEFAHDLLLNEADSFYSRRLAGEELSGNIMDNFIILYEVMKKECKIIKEYNSIIGEIELEFNKPNF